MKRILAGLLLTGAMSPVWADIVASDAYARATPPGLSTTAAFMTLRNDEDKAVELIGANASGVAMAEVHHHSMNDGVMSMSKVDALTIPAHGSVTLAPGGYHMMLMGLDHGLSPGDSMQVELLFKAHAPVDVTLTVKPIEP